MSTHRSHLITAAALLTGTALAGAAAHDLGAHPPAIGPAASPPITFSAPSSGPVRFSGTLDRSAVRLGEDGTVRMELVIAGAADADAARVRRPTDLVVILDRSGSMDGAKIVHARAAVRELLAELGAQDRFALVTYADAPSTEVALAPVTDAARRRWGGLVGELAPGGGTNMSAGIDVGLELIERSRRDGRVPRAILISDGLANLGDASPEGLTRRARRAARGEYMLSTVGVGTDFNEQLMTALADAGTGNYYFVHDPRELATVFAREFDRARTTVASGLSVRIEPAAGVRVVDAAGYPLEHDGGATVFRPGALFAGQTRRIWVTLAAPQRALGTHDLGRFALSYGGGSGRTELAFSETPRIACVGSDDEYYDGIDVAAWGRAVVVDAYHKVQEEVARDVQAGRRERALDRISQFKDETTRMNARVQSPPVAAQLEAIEQLEADVGASFRGSNQAERRNLFGKAAGAAATDARRVGAK